VHSHLVQVPSLLSILEMGALNNVVDVAIYSREGYGSLLSDVAKALAQTYGTMSNVFGIVFLSQSRCQGTCLGMSIQLAV
jgi:hypothetical protein